MVPYSHSNLQEIFIPFRGESVNGSTVVFTSCMNFRKAVGECARVSSRSFPGSETEGMDPEDVEPKARM